MGKKSRRKAPKSSREAKAREARDQTENGTAGFANRFREPAEYNADEATKETLLIAQFRGAEMAGLNVEEPKQVVMAAKYMYLVVLQANKKKGLEAALRAARRWPSFSPHWRRVKRRICEFCGKRKDLSEPRLWVCGGCGVARYCDEECQANDSWHLGDCCLKLACEWDGVGPIPTRLLSEVSNPFDPKVVPSARARKRLEAWVTRPVTPEEVERLRGLKK